MIWVRVLAAAGADSDHRHEAAKAVVAKAEEAPSDHRHEADAAAKAEARGGAPWVSPAEADVVVSVAAPREAKAVVVGLIPFPALASGPVVVAAEVGKVRAVGARFRDRGRAESDER